MKSSILILLLNIVFTGIISSQCVLPSGSYNWGLSELSSHITSSCGGSLSSGLTIPTDATISIQNNDVWDLTAYGAVVFTIQGNGSLGFNGSDELILATGSSLVIENTSNTAALQESGAGTNIRITIGTTTYTGDDFVAIITAGGANQDGVLPVELLSFSGKVLQESKVELNWETITENNNSHFDIQHSTDGLNFETIGTVKGAGSSINYRAYNFIDATPNQGINYYRLLQVDYDGKLEYLKTIVVKLSTSDFFELNYQTYSALSFHIKHSASLMIFDFSGKIINASSLDPGEHVLNLSELHKGQYIIHIHTKSEQKIMRIIN